MAAPYVFRILTFTKCHFYGIAEYNMNCQALNVKIEVVPCLKINTITVEIIFAEKNIYLKKTKCAENVAKNPCRKAAAFRN